MSFGQVAPLTPCPAHLYDALDAEGVTILACAPVGLVSNLDEYRRECLLVPYPLTKLAEVLLCSRERLAAEIERTCSVPDAFSLILEEKVRGGVFNFSDLLVPYSIGKQARLIISPTAEHASITMLESKETKGSLRTRFAQLDTWQNMASTANGGRQ